jgi:RNA polymerase sigma-70 factor (ECF subfamily)
MDRLMEAVAGGDRPAFASLYDVAAPMAYGLIRRVLRNDAIAEEVLQEVMLEVWRTAPRYDAGRGRAVGWINTIAHRRAVNRVRSEEASRRRDAENSQIERPYDEVSERVVGFADRQSVSASLDTLTEIQRETIQLSYYDGLTYQEISVRLDVPVNTIKTRMRDGLTRLRTAYEAQP